MDLRCLPLKLKLKLMRSSMNCCGCWSPPPLLLLFRPLYVRLGCCLLPPNDERVAEAWCRAAV